MFRTKIIQTIKLQVYLTNFSNSISTTNKDFNEKIFVPTPTRLYRQLQCNKLLPNYSSLEFDRRVSSFDPLPIEFCTTFGSWSLIGATIATATCLDD